MGMRKVLPILIALTLTIGLASQEAFAGTPEENSVHALWNTNLGVPSDADTFEWFSSEYDLFINSIFDDLHQAEGSCIDRSPNPEVTDCFFVLANFVDPLNTKTIKLEIVYSGTGSVDDISIICHNNAAPNAVSDVTEGVPVSASSSTTPGGVTTATYEFVCHPNPDFEQFELVITDITVESVEIWTRSFHEELVGGTFLPIDSTSLLLAGTQITASWVIPVIISAVGIVLVFVRKSENS